jgi:hypothetical protein
MEKIIRITVLLSLVLVIIASMAAIAVATPKGKGAGGGGSATALGPGTHYADDAGWVKSVGADGICQWVVEDYTDYPTPGSGSKLLMTNTAGATASFEVEGCKQVEIFAAKYWSCGNAEILLDGVHQTEVDLYNLSSLFVWGKKVSVCRIPADGLSHTVTIRALGTGGPGNPSDPNNPLNALHYVNIQYIQAR